MSCSPFHDGTRVGCAALAGTGCLSRRSPVPPLFRYCSSFVADIAGHGSQQAEDGDDFEEDGLDDTLVPLDYQEAGQIVDDVCITGSHT